MAEMKLATPIGAGVVCALVGFTSSFAVVLAGLRGAGASPAQAASGLLAVTVLQGIGILLLAWRFRLPITLAWSTPGAALLASTGVVAGGWPAAVGAFIVTGILIVISGFWSGLARMITRIPPAVAAAMLAGVLFPLCIAPITALAHSPWAVGPVLICWLVLMRWAPKWAVPGAFVGAAVVIAISLMGQDLSVVPLVPSLELTVPGWTWQAMAGIALPLFIVTMASQNIPGVAVMETYDYRVPWRPAMVVTGVGTVAGASAGGHAINLAALSAALAAGPDAGPDRDRRWIAAVTAGWTYLGLAAVSAALASIVTLAPDGVIQAVAGVALLGAFGSALRGAVASEKDRAAAVVAFVVAASNATIGGIGSAFWALVAGIAYHLLMRFSPARAGGGAPDRAE